MKKTILTIAATLAVIVAALLAAFAFSACVKKADSYAFTVVYEDGTPVNGLTDGTAGVKENGDDGTEVQIQICAVDSVTHETGFCTTPQAIGADGKIEIKPDESKLGGNQKWHVQINGMDGYTYEDLYLDGYGEYKITLVAKN